MKKGAHNLHAKEKQLLRLYSRWQETRRESVQRQCIALLGEIEAMKPRFNLRTEFQAAF